MRTNEERTGLIHKRTAEIKRERQKKNQRTLDMICIAACLILVVGIGSFMPGLAAALRHKDRRFLILALFFVCVSMGTLYWVLHLFIFGNVPQVFYVSEFSWLAAYLFLLSFQMVRTDRVRPFFSAVTVLRSAYGGGCSGDSDIRPVLFCFCGICRSHVRDRISRGMAAPAQRRRRADRLLAAALRGTAASPVCGVRFYAGLYPL